jgi:DNA-binding beta-propeller fold protein YncE
MRTRTFVVAATLMSVLGGCTGGAVDERPEAGTVSSATVHDILVLSTSDGSVLFDSGSGAVLARDAGALVAPDGSRLYSTTRSGTETTLQALDAASGTVLSTATLEGSLDARVASLSGRSIALMHAMPAGQAPWVPVPRAHTTIVVADPTGERAARRYRLDGNFEPEAFSIDDRRLFMIQYLPAEAPAAYRVTTLQLADGAVRPVFGHFDAPPERMPGIRLRQMFDPRTDQLYTLYTTRSEYSRGYWEGYGDEPAKPGEAAKELTFVHVLNLRAGWAYCAGLPRRLWGQPARALAMSTSPDGRTLYVVESVGGIVSEMDTKSLKIRRTKRVDLGSLQGTRTSVSTSVDGSTLFVGSASDGTAVYAIDTRTLRMVARWEAPGTVADLGLSDDGDRLYAAIADRVAVLDPSSGAELGTLPIGDVDAIVDVQTPDS